MSTLYVLRHGESTSNSGENDCTDPSLTFIGKEQSKNIIIPPGIDLIIISPLLRTMQTYEYSNIDKSLRKQVLHLCQERVFHQRDILEGQELIIETDEQFFERVEAFKNHLRRLKDKYWSILVVSHAYFLSALSPEFAGMKNCELRRLKTFL